MRQPRSQVFPQLGRRLLVLALLPLGYACGCVSTSEAAPGTTAPQAAPATKATTVTKDAKVTPHPQPDLRVQPRWEKQMLDQLADDPAKYHEAWGLFSSGGWSDAGQIMVFTDASKSSYHLAVADPNKQKVTSERNLTPAEFTAAVGPFLATADTLADVNNIAFDALTYAYLHAYRDDRGQVHLARRLFIRPIEQKPAPAQSALIKAFQSLRPTPKP